MLHNLIRSLAKVELHSGKVFPTLVEVSPELAFSPVKGLPVSSQVMGACQTPPGTPSDRCVMECDGGFQRFVVAVWKMNTRGCCGD